MPIYCPQVPGVEPSAYVADVLHVMLRVIPAVYKWTVGAHCDATKVQEVQAWFLTDSGHLIGKNNVVQSATCGVTVSLSNEFWPGATCVALMDRYDKILGILFEKESPEYNRVAEAWQAFLRWYYEIGKGCANDYDEACRNEHAGNLAVLGEAFTLKMLVVCPAKHFTVYMHIIACHIPDQASKYGSLVKLSSQGAEAAHQWVKFITTHRSNRAPHQVAGTVVTSLVAACIVQAAQGTATRSKGNKRRGAHGHMSGPELQLHEATKATVMGMDAALAVSSVV
jgi:hypothetical protein